jgi:preprotein translocase subunit SecA
MLRNFLRGFRRAPRKSALEIVLHRRDQLALLSDDELKTVPNSFAKAAVVAERVLGLRPHDEQILGAMAIAGPEGKGGAIAEMQTGEGKTLAAVLAVAEIAQHGPVHVLTANDYLAKRDAEWMGRIYDFLDLTAGYITHDLAPDDRRRAYQCDITYATPNEVGFDFLRDQLVLTADDLVLPPFGTALIDEADSILIDEARIPLVIAGGNIDAEPLARQAAVLAESLHAGRDFRTDEYGRNVRLTDRGANRVEHALHCGNLYAPENIDTLAAIEAALHARVLLRRDVDYIVRGGAIELVDEFKGRIAENRRWPAGLQTAIEAKEGLSLRSQGRILGSITLQALVRLYPRRCGMTGTAATAANEFREFYGLDVVVIPTHRPMIRADLPDAVFEDRFWKEKSVIRVIGEMHALGRPVLVGTASVQESERLSSLLEIPHRVLNARQDAEEASIVARAGERGTVTISTNMAGRGTDIVLGEGVAALGGLHVIGTNRHESRRIDHQLRGRAGRQGDPGSSQFFVSFDDDLLARYGIRRWRGDVDAIQKIIEGQHFDARMTLWKYGGLVEDHRKIVHAQRRELLMDGANSAILQAIDSAWSDYLAAVEELREGIHWRSWGGREPFHEFIEDAEKMFADLMARIDAIAEGDEAPEPSGIGATWTYLVNDNPFGSMGERIAAGVRRVMVDHGLLRG